MLLQTENGAKVLLTSHLGRPKSGPEDKFRWVAPQAPSAGIYTPVRLWFLLSCEQAQYTSPSQCNK